MKKIILAFAGTFLCQLVQAQHKFEAIVKDSSTNEPLIGALVVLKGTVIGVSADTNGRIILGNIPSGKQVLVFSFPEFKRKEIIYDFPLADSTQIITILLEEEGSTLGEVVVTSTTRSSRSILDIPTRIETIASGELEEKAVMQPGNIKMLLTESTGIQTQQTSQVSGSASIRIQGLDGKYTQLLQDGFPLYSGFSSGLSILQIPPLNLKRVEVIKGATSTLYGGGAIAGLINLVTKEPTEKKEVSFLLNGNQTSALDVSSFYSQRYKKTGMTLYTAGNFQKAYDNNNDGFSDIPEFSRYTINPKFFYYPNERTTLSIGLNAGIEKRTGGDLQALKGNIDTLHTYFERNNSNRYSVQTKFEKTFENRKVLTLKNSIGYFNRIITRPSYRFEGQQVATFSEANYLVPKERTEWIFGISCSTDDFKQLGNVTNKLNYFNAVFGAFGQNNLNLTKKLIVESGLRIDLTNRQQVFVLPRLSLLYKVNRKLTSRIGGGLGYKSPTIFSEDAEERAFQNILPLDFSLLRPEKSYGLNADVNYKTLFFDRLFLSINQMFFYTSIQNPLVISNTQLANVVQFENANGTLETKGFETNLKLKYKGLSCFIGYTFIEASRNFNKTISINPLTSKHRINANLMYEWEEKLRIAYEAFYVGPQYLNTDERTRSYWVMGVSAEYKFQHISIFLNFENFLDTRQSHWESMYSGSVQNPQFRQVYTPTDGVIFNGGIRVYFTGEKD